MVVMLLVEQHVLSLGMENNLIRARWATGTLAESQRLPIRQRHPSAVARRGSAIL